MVTCSLFGFWNRKSWGWQNFWGNKLSPLIWYGKADDDDTSQHLLDPYSFDHVTAGIVQYLLIPPIGTSIYDNYNDDSSLLWTWFLINILIHAGWEFFENTPCVIYYFRSSKVDPVYIGDSVVNTICDIILAGIGWWIAYLTYQYVSLWLTLIIILILQIISYFMGSGFFMIIQRLIKSIFCPTNNDNDNNNSNDNDNNNVPNDSDALLSQ